MIKIFLLCVIFCCCVLVGLKIKEYLKRRLKFYKNFCSFCETLKNKISFSNDKIASILIEQLQETNDVDFKKFLKVYLDYIQSNISKLEFQKKLSREICFLNKDEQTEVFTFLFNLGSFSKDEEISTISNYLTKISVKIIDLNLKYVKFSNLYLKLFIILGLMLFVIFI